MKETFQALLLALIFMGSTFASAEDPIVVSDMVTIDKSAMDRSLNGGVVSYAAVLRETRPSVVSVYSKSFDALSPKELMLEYLWGDRDADNRPPAIGLGSGVIVSENGYILTNDHVVRNADELTVRVDGNRIYDARIVGTDPKSDIAVIKIEASGLPAAVLADSDAIEVGDVVFAIGNPLGLGKTVTMGIVSATGRHTLRARSGVYEDFIQTDAPINSGNSGGALVDAMGRLVGINTMIQTDGRSTGNIGIGFAVPVNMAYWVMRDLIEKGAVSRGFLGVGIEALDRAEANRLGVDSLDGAIVRSVADDSPAERAGLRSGDIIRAVDDDEVDSPNALRLSISRIRPGTEVSLGIVREGAEMVVEVVLAELGPEGGMVPAAPEVQAPDELEPTEFLRGVTIETVDEGTREVFGLDASIEGVVVTALEDGSPYVDQLSVGMVIVKINGQTLTDADTAGHFLQSGKKNMFHVAFSGVHRWVSIPLD